MEIVATPIFNSLKSDQQAALKKRVAEEIDGEGLTMSDAEHAEYLETAAKQFKDDRPYQREVMEGAENHGGDLRPWRKR